MPFKDFSLPRVEAGGNLNKITEVATDAERAEREYMYHRVRAIKIRGRAGRAAGVQYKFLDWVR